MAVTSLLAWILVPFAAYVAVISAYMLAVAAGAWLYRPPGGRGRGARFVVIVPAHNEGRNLVPTLQGLSGCEYSPGHAETWVIADNCADDTAAIARAHGAQVFERHDLAARGKGPALDWLLKTQRERLASFDAVVFVDADMFVDKGFLSALDAALSDPAVEVGQARYTVANPADSWVAAFTHLSFAYVNHVRPAGRCFLGGSAGLKGSGMVFRRELILETGWPASSLAEDLEFGKDLTLRGIRIHYVPGAMVTSNIGGKLKQASVQQSRWEGGKFLVSRRYFPLVVRRLLARPSALLGDEFLDLLVPPLSVVVLLLALGCGLSLSIGSWMLATPFLAGIVVFAAAVLTGLVQVGAPRRALLYLAVLPLFVLLKVGVLARSVFASGRSGWKRTPRDNENM